MYMTREQYRKITNYTALTLSGLAALFGLFWLVFILGDVLVHASERSGSTSFSRIRSPPGCRGAASGTPSWAS